MKCSDIEKYLEKLAPRALASHGDNIGMIAGRSDKNVSRIVVAYRIDQETVEYAVDMQADLIVSHEPVISEPLLQIGSGTYQGRMILKLLRNDISCYAMRSNFDLCRGGSADWIASKLGLSRVHAIDPLPEYIGPDGVPVKGGRGRLGGWKLPRTLRQICIQLSESVGENLFKVYSLRDSSEDSFTDIAVIPGGEMSCMDAAIDQGAQLIITCSLAYEDAVQIRNKQKTVLELSGGTVEQAFTDCVEQYLAEVISSDVDILSAPVKRPFELLELRKE